MIYTLLGIIVILIAFYIRQGVQKEKIIKERDEAFSKIGFLNKEIKILTYNYTSLKKVHSTVLRKNKTLAVDHKKLQITLGRKK